MEYNIKRNLLYFEAETMRALFEEMNDWQVSNNARYLSTSIQADSGRFCCIALTNPTEVVITSADGKRHVQVESDGSMWVVADVVT
jgi:hypothetical protein